MIIGFLARRRAGKDTSCEYIQKKHGFVSRAYAEPLKQSVKVLFGFSDEQLYSDKKEDIDPFWGVSPRRVFQFFGTDIVRNMFPELVKDIGNDFWVRSFDCWYQKNKNKNIVVSDVRFQNEVDYIKNQGGYIIKLERDSDVIEDSSVDTHNSEAEVDKIKNYDIVISNNSTLQDLYNELDKIVEKIINKR